jgi:hypothetical protein
MTSPATSMDGKMTNKVEVVIAALLLLIFALLIYVDNRLYSAEEIRNLNLSVCEKENLKKMYENSEHDIGGINKRAIKVAREHCDEKAIKEKNARKERVLELLK